MTSTFAVFLSLLFSSIQRGRRRFFFPLAYTDEYTIGQNLITGRRSTAELPGNKIIIVLYTIVICGGSFFNQND